MLILFNSYIYSNNSLLLKFSLINNDFENQKLLIFKINTHSEILNVNKLNLIKELVISKNFEIELENCEDCLYRFLVIENENLIVDNITYNYFYLLPTLIENNIEIYFNSKQVLESYYDNDFYFNKSFKIYQNIIKQLNLFVLNVENNENFETIFINRYRELTNPLKKYFKSDEFNEIEKIFIYSQMDPDIHTKNIEPFILNKSNNKFVSKFIESINENKGINNSFIIYNSLTDINFLKSDKFKLIVFWTSWCGPCRKHNQNELKEYFNKYSDKFEIISISLDENKQAWESATKQDKIQWTNIHDSLGLKSKYMTEYKFNSFPKYLILNSQNKIIYSLDNIPISEIINKIINY